MCGVNAAQMDAALECLKSDVLHPLFMTIHPMIVTTLRADGWSNVKRRGRGIYSDAIKFTSCWEADHIKAVIAGGGECGIDNYRTLCFVCHKNASAEQARARASARRLKKHASHISTYMSEIAKVPHAPERPDDTKLFLRGRQCARTALAMCRDRVKVRMYFY